MKIEFNENGFSAEINQQPEEYCSVPTNYSQNFFKNNKCILLSAASVFLSLISIIFSVFINVSKGFFNELLGENTIYLMVLIFTFAFLILAVSILCGAFSIVFFKKSKKNSTDYVGFISSIFSFILNFISLILNTIGIIL